ncbi:MAG: hypothetical protein Q9180_001386 [Flavoplaca navasiana]
MTQKRKTHPSNTNGVQSKRHHFDNAGLEQDANPATQAQVDPTYGQRSAFPGLDRQPDADDLFYAPAADGFEYLRMVRSEAKGVPNLLTSAKLEETHLYQDYPRGYYDDGAYTAMPLPPAAGPTKTVSDDDVDPQEAYYANLCNQHRSLHTALHASSPPSAPDESTASLTRELNAGLSSRIWRMTILYTQPTSTLLSRLDQDAVVAGIAALEKHLAWKTLEKESYLGAWAWGLLARCREVGMMGSDEVGVIRDLGKKARSMVRLLAAGLGGAQGTQGEENKEQDERDDENLLGEDGGRRPEDPRENDMNEGETIDKMKPTEGIPVHKDVDNPRPSDTWNGDAMNSLYGDGLTSVNKHQQPPTTSDDEIAEAQARLLTTLHDAIPPNPPDPLTTSGDYLSSTPQRKNSLVVDQPFELTSQGSSSATEGSLPLNPISLTMRVAATLDMIITIVGEAYGQKDLLEGRIIWD